MPNEFVARRFVGYRDDPRNAFAKGDKALLSSPSKNVRITTGGKAITRDGYEALSIDLGSSGNEARGFHMIQYDLTFYAVGTKIYYTEGDPATATTKVDTGITITGGQAKNTRFEEAYGQIFVGNKTDGWHMIAVMRLNGAVSAGAASIKVDSDGLTRVTRFDTKLSITTANLRINGTDEEYDGKNAGASTFTLSGTASQAYSDNTIAIVVYDLTSTYPKCAKVVFWKGALHFIDVDQDDTTFSQDMAPNTLTFTAIFTPTTIEDVLTITASNSEVIGTGGRLVNAVVTRDYLYLFKENRVAYIDQANVTTGNARPVIEFDNVDYGCASADAAVNLGNGTIMFVTQNKRVMAIRTSTEDGATTIFPDELFDSDIEKTVESFDDDQSDALCFFHSGMHLAYAQVNIDSTKITLVLDTNLVDSRGLMGRWLPPDDNKNFVSYFERKGWLHATAFGDDTVFILGTGFKDNGQDIDCQMWTAELTGGETETMSWKSYEVSGSITQDSEIDTEGIVDESTAAIKTINSSDYAFTGGQSFDQVAIGEMILGGGKSLISLADFNEEYVVAPVRYGIKFQLGLTSTGAFSWDSYTINASPLSRSPVTRK